MIAVRTTQFDHLDPDMINLGIGQPGFDLLPLSIMRRAAAARLAEGDTTLLNYGYEKGDGRFRVALARFLERHYDAPIDAETLMTTAGATQALDMICTYFSAPGDTVFVEEPSYFLALRIFADHGLNVVGLPTDEEGLDVDALAQALERETPAFVYLVPTFQNPSGVTLSAPRRQRLLQLSREHDFYVVADEVYHLLNYTADEVPPALGSLVDSEDGARVLSVGSFSKILAPGLRLGWLQAAPPLLERLTGSGLLDSGGGLSPFVSNLVRVVLDRGWQEAHLSFLKETYERRLRTLDAALRRHLGDRVSYRAPDGGFFFWVALSPDSDARRLLPAAQAHNVGFHPGTKFSSQGGLQRYMRLCFAFYDEERLETGVARLAQVVDAS